MENPIIVPFDLNTARKIKSGEYDFKPFDKVLVRDEDDKEWHISLFAREIVDDSDGLSYKYECSNGTLWNCCIPFEGNEYLLGTVENPEELIPCF